MSTLKTGLMDELKSFVETHPDGWNDGDWNQLLTQLNQEGHDTSDREQIGWTLEQERLAFAIRRKEIPGFGAKRIQAVVERFGTVWNLRHASASDIAEIPTIHKSLAEKLESAFHA